MPQNYSLFPHVIKIELFFKAENEPVFLGGRAEE